MNGYVNKVFKIKLNGEYVALTVLSTEANCVTFSLNNQTYALSESDFTNYLFHPVPLKESARKVVTSIKPKANTKAPSTKIPTKRYTSVEYIKDRPITQKSNMFKIMSKGKVVDLIIIGREENLVHFSINGKPYKMTEDRLIDIIKTHPVEKNSTKKAENIITCKNCKRFQSLNCDGDSQICEKFKAIPQLSSHRFSSGFVMSYSVADYTCNSIVR